MVPNLEQSLLLASSVIRKRSHCFLYVYIYIYSFCELYYYFLLDLNVVFPKLLLNFKIYQYLIKKIYKTTGLNFINLNWTRICIFSHTFPSQNEVTWYVSYFFGDFLSVDCTFAPQHLSKMLHTYLIILVLQIGGSKSCCLSCKRYYARRRQKYNSLSKNIYSTTTVHL